MNIYKRYNINLTKFEDLFTIEAIRLNDERGSLNKVYSQADFKDLNFDFPISEIIETQSRKGVLRGLHIMSENPQAKLIRVTKGRIFDVAVDLRKNSKTFGKHFTLEISSLENIFLFIPAGFAHGFLTLEEDTIINYLCTSPYIQEFDTGLIWNDLELNISWPLDKIDSIIISEKDNSQVTLKEFIEKHKLI